MDKKTDIFCKI